ncbi:PKD-like family lipoprotein [Pedobacter hiemivivus]|uniref:PKD-like family protein n=1 Tax=Pedobacter hiemivivus TaxID=2530454 RepID=A0A4R0NGI5_9SPHI|nr:PKD-like family lipoprotein [Pedobacter hiemivivus]TCC99650.1 hypothetical protein EZ444_02980 [Pedobacter hiemivivus]
MKIINTLLLTGFVLFAASCKKDKSNYDYKSAEVFSISNFKSAYTVISEKDHIVADPIITSTDPEADFEYRWWIYGGDIVGVDTLSKTKQLDYLVKKSTAQYGLVFKVTNRHTKYTQYYTANVNVGTAFTTGWYVAKDDGNAADLDLFLTPSSIVPEGKFENIYSTVNGSKLEGKAMMMNYFGQLQTTISRRTSTLFLTTDKTIAGVYISTLKAIRNFNTSFIEPPAISQPDFVFFSSGAYYLGNAGQCYAINLSSSNSGQFGARKLKDADNTPYHLSKYFLASGQGDPLFFDETSSSFLTSPIGSGLTLARVNDDVKLPPLPPTGMPAINNQMQPLYIGYKSRNYNSVDSRYEITGYGVFQDKRDATKKVIAKLAPNSATTTKLYITNEVIKPADKIYNATLFTLLVEDENIMYFVLGNEVWSRNLSNGFEQLQFTAPAGELITYIRHKALTVGSYPFNYFMIGTKVGENYKVRMFTKSSGNLSASPHFTLEGKGIVRDVMYVSPNVSDGTYSNTY